MCPEITELRRLCHKNGIFNLAALAAFASIAPGVSQQEIARRSGQTDSSLSQWIVKFQLWGLIETETGPMTFKTGKRKGQTVMRVTSVRHSEEGKALLLRIRGILRSSHADVATAT